MKEIRPQEGFQLEFLSSKADIAIGGSAAGVGKSFASLLDGLRHINNPNFTDTIFRRTRPQIRNAGGLWDESVGLYSQLGANSSSTLLKHKFKSGSEIRFSHLEYEKDIYSWQGAQLPSIKFEEMTHFTERQFWYMLSRNRSTCGVRPYFRGTCNPDPDSFLAELGQWWIDEGTGVLMPERSGKLRYLFRNGGELIWGDTFEEVAEEVRNELKESIEKANGLVTEEHLIKSVTFIGGSIYDNKELLKVNPQYLGNLLAQDEDEKEILLHGNWKVKVSGDELYNREKFKQITRNTEVGTFKVDEYGNEIDYNPYKRDRFITADIALEGSDLFVIFAWQGFVLIDFEVLPKSDGKQVIDAMEKMAEKNSIPRSNACYDADGVGGFVGGWIGVPFHNGSAVKENYANLKTMCAYMSAKRVNKNNYYILHEVANRRIKERKNKRLIDVLMDEQRAFRKYKSGYDGKLQIIPKKGDHSPDKPTMKGILGFSPDFMDAFIMREYFEITPPAKMTKIKGLI